MFRYSQILYHDHVHLGQGLETSDSGMAAIPKRSSAWRCLNCSVCRTCNKNYRGVLATDDPAWWGSKKRHRNWRRSHVLVLDPFRNGNLSLECILIWKWSVRSLWLLVTLGGVLVLQQLISSVMPLCEISFYTLPFAEFPNGLTDMSWSKWFFQNSKYVPFFLSCIWPLKATPCHHLHHPGSWLSSGCASKAWSRASGMCCYRWD